MKSSNIFKTDNIISSISKQYQRTEDSLNEDVTKLKLWMQTQPHLPEILDDKSIQNFLILNKCSVEKAKQRIDMYYTLRSRIPDMYENINPQCSNMKEVAEIIYWVLLPKLTKENYRVFLFKMRNQEMIDRMEPHDVIGFVNNLQELRLKEDVMFGDISIIDMEGVTLGYLAKLTPTILSKVLAVYEKVYSIPLKGLYILNSPPFISTVLNIIKSLLKPKIVQRIHVCEDTSILQERFPKEMLPKDYGGEEKSMEELHGMIKLKLREHQDRFNLLDTLRVDESLRPEKLENNEMLGFYGNFKKLSVD